jgi:hypothetical protein
MPPALLGVCPACLFFDPLGDGSGRGWCRYGAPVLWLSMPPVATSITSTTDTRRGRWPLVTDTDWCGQWQSPQALPMELALSPGGAPRNTGLVTVLVFANSPGQFVQGDTVRFNGIEQPTTWVTPSQLRWTCDTQQPVGDYPVRVSRPSAARLSEIVMFRIA